MSPRTKTTSVSTGLTDERLEELLQAADVSQLSEQELERYFRDDQKLVSFAPAGDWAEDPRTGEHVLFNPARARRPSSFATDRADVRTIRATKCPICRGNTTGVLDSSVLSEGQTFINKNLYAAIFPHAKPTKGPRTKLHGMHFLQWTSTIHSHDWHNMPLKDCAVVMRRLAALEHTLLNGKPSNSENQPVRAVSIIKNYGVAVGASLAHGHQQIIASDFLPRRLRENADFQKRTGEAFSAYMLRQNPAELKVRETKQGILVVPYFMQRPFNMLWLLRDVNKQYLHQLNDAEIKACATAWHDVMRVYLKLMPAIGRTPSFNILVHNGPGAGLYCEFLPFTQEYGGFERLGISICQSAPEPAAAMLRLVLQT